MNRGPHDQAARGEQRSTSPDLFLNFLPVALSAETVAGSLLTFQSSDQLRQLRAEYVASHVFRRQGDQIACIPLTAIAPAIGNPMVFETRRSAALIRRLLQDALIRCLSDWKYKLVDFDPPSFIARHPTRDLLAQAAGKQASDLSWLHVYPRYTLDPRVLFGRGGPQFGILVGFRTRREIDLAVADLMERGLDIHGRYVLSQVDDRGTNPLRDPFTQRRAVGRVGSVDGNRLILEDAPRLREVSADQAWLEASLENFADALGVSGAPAPQTILRELDRLVFDLVGATGRHQRLLDIARWLKARGELLLADGLSCTIDMPVALRRGMDGGAFRRFGAPTFIFDAAGTKTARIPDQGMENFGPFDAEVFTPKRPHVVVVTPKSYQGDVEVFLRKFKEGIPNAKTFAQGFTRKYRLSDCSFRVETFDPEERESVAYRQACLHALTQTPKPNLAFVIVKQEHKALPARDDPYLIAKSTFMAQGVPVQEVLIETIRIPPNQERSVPYTLSGIALVVHPAS